MGQDVLRTSLPELLGAVDVAALAPTSKSAHSALRSRWHSNRPVLAPACDRLTAGGTRCASVWGPHAPSGSPGAEERRPQAGAAGGSSTRLRTSSPPSDCSGYCGQRVRRWFPKFLDAWTRYPQTVSLVQETVKDGSNVVVVTTEPRPADGGRSIVVELTSHRGVPDVIDLRNAKPEEGDIVSTVDDRNYAVVTNPSRIRVPLYHLFPREDKGSDQVTVVAVGWPTLWTDLALPLLRQRVGRPPSETRSELAWRQDWAFVWNLSSNQRRVDMSSGDFGKWFAAAVDGLRDNTYGLRLRISLTTGVGLDRACPDDTQCSVAGAWVSSPAFGNALWTVDHHRMWWLRLRSPALVVP